MYVLVNRNAVVITCAAFSCWKTVVSVKTASGLDLSTSDGTTLIQSNEILEASCQREGVQGALRRVAAELRSCVLWSWEEIQGNDPRSLSLSGKWENWEERRNEVTYETLLPPHLLGSLRCF